MAKYAGYLLDAATGYDHEAICTPEDMVYSVKHLLLAQHTWHTITWRCKVIKTTNRIYVKISIYDYEAGHHRVIQRDYKTATKAFRFCNHLKTMIGLSNTHVARQAGKPFGLLRRWLSRTYGVDGYLVALPGVFYERTLQIEEPKPVMDDVVLPPVPGGRRVVIYDEAHKLSMDAQKELLSVNLSPQWPNATQRSRL